MSLNIEEQYDKIYAYCYFKLNNSYIAEDITQETFFKYFNQKNYIDRGKPLALLYTIARNLCIDYFRKNNKEILLNEIEENYIESDNTTNIAIKQVIKTLPEEDREIIILRFFNDLEINEISKIFNISRFSVSRRINKSLKYLKTILKKEDFY